MRRVITVSIAVAALGLLSWSWAAPAPPAPMTHAEKLDQKVHFKGFDDPKTSLTEALDNLGRTYDITFDINEKAFKYEQVMEVGKTEIAQPPIPEMTARLRRVIDKVLSRIPAPSGAVCLVRADHLEITTSQFAGIEIWGNARGLQLPLVHLHVKGKPLGEVLPQLAEQAEFNIVIDNRARDQSKTEVTAQLRNAPLDSAVRLLADMADLRYVHLDNMLYVTTKENAAAMEARLSKDYPVDPNAEVDPNNPRPPRKGAGRNLIITGAAQGGM